MYIDVEHRIRVGSTDMDGSDAKVEASDDNDSISIGCKKASGSAAATA